MRHILTNTTNLFLLHHRRAESMDGIGDELLPSDFLAKC